MGKNPVRHHIIPVCYLSRFADEKGSLYVYDKLENMIRQDKPENICFIKHYNDLMEETCEQHNLDKTAVESYYAESIEAEYKSVLESTCSIVKQAFALNVEPKVNRALISKHLWCQFLRLAPFAYSIQDMWTQLFQQFKEKCPNQFDENLFRSSPSPLGDDPILLQAQLLGFQSTEFEQNFLDKHTWEFLYSNDGSFITSDYPVITIQLEDDGRERITTCLFPYNAILVFPLSPNILLIIMHKDIADGKYRELDGRIYEATPEQLAHFNSIIRDAAKRWVISPKNNIEISGIIDRNPYGDKNIFVDKNKYNISW